MIHSLTLPEKVISGQGSFQRIPELVATLQCKKACIITDSIIVDLGYVDTLTKALTDMGIRVNIFSGICGEPTFSLVEELCRNDCYIDNELFIAIGGGSVIDTAKILSVVVTNRAFAEDFKDITRIQQQGTPLIAVPTTAGTGAEATPNAILFDTVSKAKIGIVSPKMIPAMVVLDCDMTKTLPSFLAAATGFDAIAHALESYLSKKCNTFTETFAVDAIRLLIKNIEPACTSNNDDARQKMLIGAFYAGICLVTSSTHVVHAMAYPLAGDFHIPHGPGIALLMLPVLQALQEGCTEKLSYLSRVCLNKAFDHDKDGAAYFVEHLQGIAHRLQLNKRLSDYGVSIDAIDKMAEDAMKIRRLMDNAPVEMTVAKLTGIYRSVF